MKAIVDRSGTLRFQDVADPVAGAGEAVVRVRAAGVNRADLAQRAGRYPPPTGVSEILGLEVAGEVEAAPSGSGFAPGDRVCALLAGGGYAERAVVPAALLVRIPDGMGFEEAAALPEAHLTAYLNLFLEGGLRAGERVLIHGGASGVGTAAVQQAREAGARVATTSSDRKRERCRELGADVALDRRDPEWPRALRDAWGGVDVILDMVGADTAAAGLDLLAVGGRLVWIAALSGARVEVDVGLLMRKRLTLKGSVLRARPVAEKAALTEAFVARFGEALARGDLRPVIDRVLPIEEAERAHDALRSNDTVGKVILTLP